MINPNKATYDVIVCGGGVAGSMAAISAARSGAKTLLVEKGPFLGGVLAMGYFPHSFYASTGKKSIGGLAEELIERLKEKQGALGHIRYEGGHLYTITPVDSEMVKITLMQMAKEAGVQMMMDTLVNHVVTDGARIHSVVLQNKEGSITVDAKVFIDCTGDGDVACRAGVPYQKGRENDGKMQPVSLAMRVSNVDTLRAMAEIPTDQAVLTVKRPWSDQEKPLYFVSRLGKWDDTPEAKELFTDKNRQMFCLCMQEDDIFLNISRVVGVDPTDACQASDALVETRLQVGKMFEFVRKYLPGFEHAHLIAGTFLGIRETRRVVCDYTMTTDDISQGRMHDDNICLCAYPMDMHDPDGGNVVFYPVGGDGSYGVPYRCMLPQGSENLLVAGRCISASHEALSSVRTMSACMCMGQAAGMAAAMAARTGQTVREIPTKELQQALTAQNAILY